MIDVANARIKAFGKSPKADFVSPSEQLITLTIGQLQDLLKEAIQPLQDEVESFRATVARQDEKIATLESTQDTQADNQLIQLRLIHELRETSKKGPGKTEISRAEKIEKYLASRPDHRGSFETLKGHLQVDNVRLNDAIKILIATSDRSYSIQKATIGDKRKRVLVMLPR
jgi:DNA repair exonuclease SbcCD ATPase subunit